MKIAFLINPKIRNYRRIKNKIQKEFSDTEFKFYISKHHGHLLHLTKKPLDAGYKILVTVGGDGSVNETVNGIIETFTESGITDWKKVSEISVGILPAGSGNDFIKNLYQDYSIAALKARILAETSKVSDIGYCEFRDLTYKPSHRYFINVADVGMGAFVVKQKMKMPAFFSGRFNYVFAIIKTFLTYRKRKILAEADDRSFTGMNMNYIVANGKYFGNALGIAPQAELDDGHFNITNLGDISLLDYFRNIGKVRKCKILRHKEIFYDEAAEVTIESPVGENLNFEMDGEFVGYSPVKIKCLPGKIKFIS